MQKIIFILLSLFVASCSTTKPLSIQTNSSDILYLGVNNPLVFKGNNLTKANVSIDNGTINELTEQSNDTIKSYIIKVDNHKPTYVTIKQNKTTTTLKYRNKKIPDPEIFIGTDSARIKSCSITENKFRTATGLGCNIPAFDYGISMKIISFKLTTIKNGKNSISQTINGNIVKNYTQFADSSDIYIFHDILMEFIETKEQRILSGPTVFVK